MQFRRHGVCFASISDCVVSKCWGIIFAVVCVLAQLGQGRGRTARAGAGEQEGMRRPAWPRLGVTLGALPDIWLGPRPSPSGLSEAPPEP